MPYLVDGNNVLGVSRHLNLSEEGAREKLTHELSRYRKLKGNEIIVVYDGPPPSGMRDEIYLGKLRVIYAGPASDADTRIKAIVKSAKDPKSFIVVSSDKQVYSYSKWAGAKAIRSDQFYNEVREVLAKAPIDKDTGQNLSSNEVDEWLDFFGVDEDV